MNISMIYSCDKVPCIANTIMVWVQLGVSENKKVNIFSSKFTNPMNFLQRPVRAT